MKRYYDRDDFELPCDTMVVAANTETKISSMAWLYFSPQLRNTERTIIVKGHFIVQGILGAKKNATGNEIGNPAYFWKGVKVEPCAEGVFDGATLFNAEMPLEILSRYTLLQEAKFIQSTSLLLPDSSILAMHPTKMDQSPFYKSTIKHFAAEDLAYFQSGRGRCKDTEKRIFARGQSPDVNNDENALPRGLISFLVYCGISATVVGSITAFSFFR